jgi:DNA-binding NtrC family response regulator
LALLVGTGPAAAIPDELMAGRTFQDWKREAERAYVARLFRDSKGDLGKMMSALGVKRTQLYVLFRKLGIDPRRMRTTEEDR